MMNEVPSHDSLAKFEGNSAVETLDCGQYISGIAFRRPDRPELRKSSSILTCAPHSSAVELPDEFSIDILVAMKMNRRMSKHCQNENLLRHHG